MRLRFTNTLLAALPLAGLLFVTPAAFAYHDSWEHEGIHEDLDRMHEEFHQFPHSKREHRRFHKELKREHKALDRSLRDDWNRYGSNRSGYGRYSYGRPYYDRD